MGFFRLREHKQTGIHAPIIRLVGRVTSATSKALMHFMQKNFALSFVSYF